jgi:phosphatidylglycerophosphatase A
VALPPLAIAFLAIPLFFVGVWACEVTARDLGAQDPGCIVWDEIVAYLPLAAISSASPWFQVLTFALFRLFDIWKPPPIRDVERHVKGGMGIMVDDVIAGAYAYIVFVIFIIVAHKGFGVQ